MHPAKGARVAAAPVSTGTDPAVLVAERSGTLMLLESATGLPRWSAQVPVPAPDHAPHVWIDGDIALAAWAGSDGNCCHLLAFDLAWGEPRWRVSIAGRSTVPSVLRGLVVFAQNPRNDASVSEAVALDLATGEVEWRTEIDGVYSPLLYSDAEGRDAVFVDERGVATMVAINSGKVRWRSRRTYPQDEAHPVIVGDRVFLTAFETQALGFDRATGEILGKGPVSPPAFVRQETGHAGRLFMLVANNGLGGVWVLEPDDDPSER